MRYTLFVLSLLFSFSMTAQVKPENGVKESKPAYYALKNATIIASPTKTFQNGTILIKGDKIEKVGLFVNVPKEAVTIDCKGKTIVPAFIEMYSDIGLPKAKPNEKGNRSPQLESRKKGPYYWNESIHPEVDANTLYSTDLKRNKELVERGFGFALTHQFDGIARGEAAFVSLGKESSAHINISSKNSIFSFQKGRSRQTYPSSQMGAIALIRQAIYDAQWYKENNSTKNLSLESLNAQMAANMFFVTKDKKEILRAAEIADEFKLEMNYYGSGNEYQVVDQLADLKSSYIVPINFPVAYDVKNPYVARQVPLSDLKHWEMAPQNPSILVRRGLDVSISSFGNKTSKDFWGNLRKSIEHGLTQEEALAALTLNPAKLLSVDNVTGSIADGKLASFIVYDGNPFLEEVKIMESWLMGDQTIYNSLPLHDVKGKYNLILEDSKLPVVIKGKGDKLNGTVTYKVKDPKSGIFSDSTAKMFVALNNSDITLQFILHNEEFNGNISLQGKVNSKLGVFEGEGLLPNGKWIKWTAVKSAKDKTKDKKPARIEPDTLNHTWFPNLAYGFDTLPELRTIIIKNATLWTNEADGIIENGTIIVIDGKINYAGPNKSTPGGGAIVIDAEGKHVTSGIIDEHSHIAISKGVNESGQAISAEVSIGDVVNPDDINIYRQLSGGVTAAQLLHGSANPIGGQSALIKLKWGYRANDMLIPNAPKFIKFALGENVKQSNWGDYNTVRFPQTRMGVEQVYFDGFKRARAYSEEWKKFKSGESTSTPAFDLELEVLNEILNSERFISCHSYVQSEINMLMHVADSMGFTINTFTHILEGYKVADKMVEHGAGGSTFSDWWAYKYEVNDAIPYNASLMMEQGVVVAINSDDAEMGRRLNQEAAKGIKYGGMSEEDAWKMVSLNPAKLLHLDDRMGSLKPGKDADIVVWSDNPLSINAKVEQTIIDGLILYDVNRDLEMREKNRIERARIITKMLEDKKAGGKTKQFFKKKKGAYHCNTIGEELSTEENHH